MLINVGCGTHRAPSPWINVDAIRTADVEPDLLATDPLRPLATFDDGTVDRVYLGHVLEHIPWPDLPGFLAGLRRGMRDGADLCAVGPDVHRVIASGNRDLIRIALEDDESYMDGVRVDQPYARHWWNCYEARLMRLLTVAGFDDVASEPVIPSALSGWPVASFADWQCAVTAKR